jgi:hypothetical protein
MTNDTRTADDIERDIEDERAQMSGTINELQKKFSVEGIVSDIGTMFRDQGGELGRAISSTVGRNPAAVALVGVGLAWLILGRGRDSASSGGRGRDRDSAHGGNWQRTLPSDREAEASWLDDGGAVYDAVSGQRTGSNGHDQSTGRKGALRKGAEAVAGAVSGAADTVRDTAKALTDKLAAGTEDLSQEAKDRVLAARRAAHDAREAAQKALTQGSRVAANLFEDQPLVVGGLALAVGAAVGGLLPHTRIEDDTLGANSDRLFAEAQRVFREEHDKAMAVLKAAANEAEGALRDTGEELADMVPEGKTAGGAIVDRLSEAANRVKDTAKQEAGRQGLISDQNG